MQRRFISFTFKRHTSKSKPDIYGIEILGNIINSIIDKKLIQHNYYRDTAIQVFLGLLFSLFCCLYLQNLKVNSLSQDLYFKFY